jgi:hypothetical protein
MESTTTASDRYERARASLAARILADTLESGSPAVLELESGRLPADLERLILAYGPARAAAMAAPRGMTDRLGEWLEALRGHVEATGAMPSVAELARRAGKSRTAAHAALIRLRAMGLVQVVE